jgi:hypothetical protein
LRFCFCAFDPFAFQALILLPALPLEITMLDENRYGMGEKLGQGEMGTVYKAG